jgi:hypothetical protein
MGMPLAIYAQLHPTPRADSKDNCGGAGSRKSAKERGTYVGRQLNPEYVEWLMGFPRGFTACEPLATGLFQSWLRSLSRCFMGG